MSAFKARRIGPSRLQVHLVPVSRAADIPQTIHEITPPTSGVGLFGQCDRHTPVLAAFLLDFTKGDFANLSGAGDMGAATGL